MKLELRWVLLGMVLAAAGIWAGNAFYERVLAQEEVATPTPSPTPQPACPKVRVFVVPAEGVEAKVKELGEEGYCVGAENLKVVGNMVVIAVSASDLYDPNAYEPGGQGQ